MDKVTFRSIDDFVLQVEEFNTVVDEIVIIGDYQWTKRVVNALVKNTAYSLDCCDLHDHVYDGYNKEYLISLFDGVICVEKYFVDGKYLDLDDGYDKVFMIGDGCCGYVTELYSGRSARIIIDCKNGIKRELESTIPKDGQIKDSNNIDQSISFYKQYPDGSDISVTIYSDNCNLIKDLATNLCEGRYD